MSFTQAEKIKLAEKALAAGVFDADPTTQWYESVNPYSLVLPASKVWTQANLLRQYPAATLAVARSNVAGPLSAAVQDLSQFGSAIRLTPVPGIRNTYVALSTYGNFTSSRLENWVQPQFIPQTSGNPSFGYAIKLFNGNPASGGTEILTTTGTTGTGTNKSVGWIWNYAGGILALADDFAIADPWVCGFRYIGLTADDATSSGIQNPTELDTSAMASGLFGYVSANSVVSRTDAADITKSRCAGIYTGTSGSITITGVSTLTKFSSLSPTPVAGQAVFLARADDESSSGAAGKATTTAPSFGAATLVGTVLDVDASFASTRTCKVLLQISPPIKRA